MTAMPYPWEVRKIVLRTFLEFGARRPSLLKEAVLADRGRCTARTYQLEGWTAVWHVQEGVLRFYDRQKRFLRRVNLLEHIVPQRVAA